MLRSSTEGYCKKEHKWNDSDWVRPSSTHWLLKYRTTRHEIVPVLDESLVPTLDTASHTLNGTCSPMHVVLV